MEKTPKVSIIVPFYNGEKYLERCLESLYNQSYQNIEVLLIDDGSTDNSLSLCKKFIKNKKVEKKFIVMHQENYGVSNARNNAIKHSSGDYIAFADCDDWMESNMIELMINSAINNNSDIVISEYNNYYENEDTIEPISLKQYHDLNFLDLICDETTKYGGFPWNKMIKKSIIKELYNENVHYYENFLFFLANTDEKTKYSVVYQKLYNYCINSNSAVHSKKYNMKKFTTLEALDKIIDYVPNKYKPFYKYLYINRSYENFYYIKKCKYESKINKKFFKNKCDIFYREIIKSKHLNRKQKGKLYIHKHFNFIYVMKKELEEMIK